MGGGRGEGGGGPLPPIRKEFDLPLHSLIFVQGAPLAEGLRREKGFRVYAMLSQQPSRLEAEREPGPQIAPAIPWASLHGRRRRRGLQASARLRERLEAREVLPVPGWVPRRGRRRRRRRHRRKKSRGHGARPTRARAPAPSPARSLSEQPVRAPGRRGGKAKGGAPV